MALYLKYRPRSFADLYGQKHVKITLQKAIELDRMAHAYIFCGPRGTGKTTTARLIAKSLNCLNFDMDKVEPCNDCEICKEINEGSLVDVIEIDAASNRGIDEIRELRESVKFAPYKAKNKIYIIDEVHMLTNEAFNALLKTLEEPPSNVYFVLATTEVHKIPDTIISRCQRFDFRGIGDEDILARLQMISDAEKFGFDESVLRLIVKKARGGMRDAISLLDQVSASGLKDVEEIGKVLGVTPEDVLENLFEVIIAGDSVKATEIVVNLTNTGYGTKQIAADVLGLLRDKLQLAVFNDNQAEQSRYVFLMEAWQKVWEVFKNSLMPEAALEVFVVKASAYFAGVNIEVPAPVKVASDGKVMTKSGANSAEGGDSAVSAAEPKVIVETKIVEKIVYKEAPAPVAVAEKSKPEIDSDLADMLASDEMPVPNIKNDSDESEVTKTSVKSGMTKLSMSSISDTSLSKAWPEVLNEIEAQVLKRTLQAAQISKDDDCILVKVNSNFHFEQINKPEYKSVIEELLSAKLGGAVDVDIQVDTSLAPSIERAANSGAVKKFNAFELDPNTGQPDPFAAGAMPGGGQPGGMPGPGGGMSADDIADFFG